MLLYMQQEGRGIGLTNKLRAYTLQDGGLDTYDANIALSFKADERDYEVAAVMLARLGVASVRLMTNNHSKAEELGRFGVKVDGVVPIRPEVTPFNERYFEAERDRFDHTITLDGQKLIDPCARNR